MACGMLSIWHTYCNTMPYEYTRVLGVHCVPRLFNTGVGSFERNDQSTEQTTQMNKKQ